MYIMSGGQKGVGPRWTLGGWIPIKYILCPTPTCPPGPTPTCPPGPTPHMSTWSHPHMSTWSHPHMSTWSHPHMSTRLHSHGSCPSPSFATLPLSHAIEFVWLFVFIDHWNVSKANLLLPPSPLPQSFCRRFTTMW